MTFVNNLARFLFELGDNPAYDWSHPILFCLEEAEVYARNLKSNAAQELYRLANTGRNLGISQGYDHGVRMLYITPRLANIATELVELSEQRFHGRMNEEGSLRKMRQMYGNGWKEAVKTLKTGEFIYRHGAQDIIKKVKVPLFKPRTRPKQTYKPTPTTTVYPTVTYEVLQWISRHQGGLIWLLFVLGVLLWVFTR